ncbi:ABC transporter permease [Candidatus Nomurabacteria bacterium]|nr:ABC transporter permease [Candidatus Nomurabacteria bacterium]
MRLDHTISTAFVGLKTNKMRSALTILGIVIGIMSIILVMSVGRGAEEMILSQVRGMGTRSIVIEPGRDPQGPSDFLELYTDSLTLDDVKAIQKPTNVQGVDQVVPMVLQVMNISYAEESVRKSVFGSNDELLDVYSLSLRAGSNITPEDVRQNATVAIIGSNIKQKLYGAQNPIGTKIKIKGKVFQVVGELAPKGNVMMTNMDDAVIVPYTTAQKYLMGINHLHALFVNAQTEDIVERVSRDLTLTLRETHGISDPSKDDFHLTTQADAVERVGMITDVLTILLVSIAAISLLVGGIGIMNIMLVSVTERTKEVGLRKAVGATHHDILMQFLAEAIILTGLGGVIGIASGFGFAYLTSLILTNFADLNWVFVFPLSATILGLVVSSSIGLVFGLYPARKAAKMNPIDALRYE